MSESKKIEKLKQRIKHWPGLFKCPICHELLVIRGGYQLQCRNNHNFDLSRKGYVNLLAGNAASSYNKMMLESRMKVAKAGLYDPLLNRITTILTPRFTHLSILDAGCGEGSHLRYLINKIDSDNVTVKSIGLDNSKEGIQLASRETSDIIWCVGDIARLPLNSFRFTLVLNILSPANYREFRRVLQDNGQLLKVIPGSEHLKELRELFYPEKNQSTYNPPEVVEHAKKYFVNYTEDRLTNKNPISSDLVPHVVKMTPLSWRIPKTKQQQIAKMGLCDITTDYHILIGNLSKNN